MIPWERLGRGDIRTRIDCAGHRNLEDCLGQLTWLWNLALDQRKTAWQEREQPLSYYDQCRHLTSLRRRDPEKWGRFAVYAQRSVLQRLDRAYKRFFAEGGFPRFKGQRGWGCSPTRLRVPVGGWWRSPRIIRRGSAAGADDGRPSACRFGRIVAGAAWSRTGT